MQNKKSGVWAEKLACVYFCLHGFKIVEHNYITGKGTGAGEVDLIVSRGKLLVFVEVKKRKNLDDAAYAILNSQKQRIWTVIFPMRLLTVSVLKKKQALSW